MEGDDRTPKPSVYESIGKLHKSLRNSSDIIDICKTMRYELSQFCPCELMFFFRIKPESSELQQISCSSEDRITQNTFIVNSSDKEWIQNLEPDSFLTFSSEDFQTDFMKELATQFNFSSASIYSGNETGGAKNLILIGSTNSSSEFRIESSEEIMWLFRATSLILENWQRNFEIEKIDNTGFPFFDFVPAAMIMCDQDGKIIVANEQALEFLGGANPDDSILGVNLLSNDLSRKSGLADIVQKAIGGEESEGENIRFKKRDGKSCYLKVRFRKVPDENDEPRVLGVLFDISHQVHLQQQLERSYRTMTEAFNELQRVDEMKTQFIDIVSHELRTPITVIRGYIDMISSMHCEGLDPAFVQKINNIRHNTERLNDVVESMLDVARMEKGTVQIVVQEASPRVILEELIASHRPMAEEKHQQLVLSIVGDVPSMKLDAKKLQVAIRNILENAIKYTPENGNIQVGLSDEGKMIHIWIKDNGIGIPLSELSRIFDRFYIVSTTKLTREVDRMGLGLPISKGIIESHGGKIWIESEVGKGTIFHINLPKE